MDPSSVSVAGVFESVRRPPSGIVESVFQNNTQNAAKIQTRGLEKSKDLLRSKRPIETFKQRPKDVGRGEEGDGRQGAARHADGGGHVQWA